MQIYFLCIWDWIQFQFEQYDLFMKSIQTSTKDFPPLSSRMVKKSDETHGKGELARFFKEWGKI